MRHQFALRIIKIGRRQSIHRAYLRGDFRIAQNDRVAHHQALGKIDHLFGVGVLKRNAKHRNIVLLVFMQFIQIRNFSKAGRTPGRPKVDQHPFALVLGKLVNFSGTVR